MKAFILSVGVLSSVAAVAGDPSGQVYGYPRAITCTSGSYEFVLKPRAPKRGEAVETFRSDGQVLVRGKMDIRVSANDARDAAESFTATDYTDPYEADRPIAEATDAEGAKIFRFYLEEGTTQPTRLQYRGQNYAFQAKCTE